MGFLFPSALTMSEPESPPSLKPEQQIATWSQKRSRIGAAVERPWLERGVAELGPVGVGQHVVVAEDVHIAKRVDHPPADGSGSDRRVPHRKAERRRAAAYRRIAAGVDPAGFLHRN